MQEVPDFFFAAKPPGRYDNVLTAFQRNAASNPHYLFSVTAGEDANVSGGFCVLCALCLGRGVRVGELGYGRYESCIRMAIGAADKVDMIDHMSGKHRDTHLMKAVANGNPSMVQHLLAVGARSSHLG